MFSIGDFARHGRVSVRMLRHYDAIGLLQPAHVERVSGYRWYEARQLSRLNRIVALKNLGFSLEQVRSILDDKVSVEELRGMLRLRRAELQSQVAAGTARLAQVEARLQIIEREGAIPVYERDAALDSRQQGYRPYVDARAGLALQRCLAPELFELFLATCGRPGGRFTVLSERLRVLHEIAFDPDSDPSAAASLSTSANRQTLREVLAAGLGQQLLFGHELTRFEAGEDGVRLHFTGGRRAGADLLVGADGVNSVVRQQYLPDARVIDTESRCIYGKTPLSDSALKLVPASLLAGFTAIVGGQVGMAAGLVQFRQRPEQAVAAIAPGVRVSPAADYLMWAVSAGHQRLGVPDCAGYHVIRPARQPEPMSSCDLNRLIH